MKWLFLIIFSIPIYSQLLPVHVCSDTTELKAFTGSGLVLLDKYGNGDNTGGGLFHRIDSTYAEGSYAFDYSGLDGLQWARIGLIDPDPTFQTLTVSGLSTLVNLKLTSIDSTGFKFLLHTKVLGDSALGKIFLDRADTTIKMGTGSDLVIIKDLAP